MRTSNNTVVTNINVGDFPIGVDITPDGKFVYVANAFGDSISVIRTSDNTVIDTINLGPGVAPVNVGVTPDGRKVFTVNEDGKSVFVIRTSDNTVIDAVRLPGQGVNLEVWAGRHSRPAVAISTMSASSKTRGRAFGLTRRLLEIHPRSVRVRHHSEHAVGVSGSVPRVAAERRARANYGAQVSRLATLHDAVAHEFAAVRTGAWWPQVPRELRAGRAAGSR